MELKRVMAVLDLSRQCNELNKLNHSLQMDLLKIEHNSYRIHTYLLYLSIRKY